MSTHNLGKIPKLTEYQKKILEYIIDGAVIQKKRVNEKIGHVYEIHIEVEPEPIIIKETCFDKLRNYSLIKFRETQEDGTKIYY